MKKKIAYVTFRFSGDTFYIANMEQDTAEWQFDRSEAEEILDFVAQFIGRTAPSPAPSLGRLPQRLRDAAALIDAIEGSNE